jgi:hypothetical protein
MLFVVPRLHVLSQVGHLADVRIFASQRLTELGWRYLLVLGNAQRSMQGTVMDAS